MIDLFLENLAHDVFHIFGESGVQIFCLFAHSYIEFVSRTRLKSVWSINGEKTRTNQSVDETSIKQSNFPITKSVSQRQSSRCSGFDAIQSPNRVVFDETIVQSNPQFHKNANKVVEITRKCRIAKI